MSIYATFFVLAPDLDADEDWLGLGPAYAYVGSSRGLADDPERTGVVTLCRAMVGPPAVRLWVRGSGPGGRVGNDGTVLLDRNQAAAMRDALTDFLDRTVGEP